MNRREMLLAAAAGAFVHLTPANGTEGTAGDLAELTLAAASRRIHSGAVTSRDLTFACLERTAAENPRINAFITVMREQALADAATLDAEASGRTAGLEGAWPHDGEPLADTLSRLGLTRDEDKVLRSYLVDGRLTGIPAQGKKRQVILRFLLERVFTEDREYPEKEVNQRLALFHPDVAALRRYLYDERYVDRDHGLYTRRTPRSAQPQASR